MRTLRAKGSSLRATEQPINTSTAVGKCFLDMLGVFAEFETNLRRERQLLAVFFCLLHSTSRPIPIWQTAGEGTQFFTLRPCEDAVI